MCTDMFKCGLCSISFRELSAERILDITKKAGLTCIEWGSDIHAPRDDRARLLEIAELSKQYGIECCSYGTYFRIGTDPKEEIFSYIEAAKTLGTDTLRLWCGAKGSEDCTEAEREAIIGDCIYLAKVAKEQNVKLCLECHIKTLTDDVNSTLSLMERVNSQNFLMYWQPNQFKTEAENIHYAKSVANITERIHVFNWEGKNKYPLIGAKEQWQRYLDCFDGGVLLLEFMPDGRPESLETEAKALYEIIGG